MNVDAWGRKRRASQQKLTVDVIDPTDRAAGRRLFGLENDRSPRLARRVAVSGLDTDGAESATCTGESARCEGPNDVAVAEVGDKWERETRRQVGSR